MTHNIIFYLFFFFLGGGGGRVGEPIRVSVMASEW